VKHSRAKSINVSIGLTDLYTLYIEYYDDGVGFDTSIERPGNGMCNIRHRVSENQGSLAIQSGINEGCHVIIEFPITILKQ
jgi:signal transduction histidine kinase